MAEAVVAPRSGDVDSSPITLEVKTERDVTPEDLDQMGKLALEEFIQYKNAPDRKTAEAEDKGTTALLNSYARGEIADRQREEKPAEIIFARNGKNEIVGYSLVGFTEGSNNIQVDNAFLGVKSSYQSQGIGTSLLAKRIERLREFGVDSYETNARPKAISLYDKLKIPHTTTPIERTASSGVMRLVVHLR